MWECINQETKTEMDIEMVVGIQKVIEKRQGDMERQ